MASEMAGFIWPPDALPGGVRGEDQPSTEQRYRRADDQQLDIDLRDHPGDERGPCHPSHDARYAEKQDEGKDQLERAVLGQWSYPFRFLGCA